MTDTHDDTPGRRARGIDRLIRICQVLHEHHGPMSARELVQATGAPRSSVYDLISHLGKAGWLESDAQGRVFFGRAMHYYGLDYADHNRLIKRARPVMRRLSAQFNETSQLCALDGDKYTVLLNEHGARPFAISAEIGIKVPIPWTASGRILLRELSREQLLERVPDEDFALPDGTRIDIDAFRADIDKARVEGYAITEGLVDAFACCMAAPVTDDSGHAIATICFTINRATPAPRRKQLVQALLEAGHALSH